MIRVCLIAGVVALAGCVSAPAPHPPAENWKLVWADEFDGENIDTSAWTSLVMPDPYNEELQYYTGLTDDAPGSNAWQRDGVLVIEAREEKYEHRKYTSARLITKGKKEFLYGRFEARIKIPDGVATWPAFWLLGANIDTKGWPGCGEIDIMEAKGRVTNWTSGAVHFGPDPANRELIAADYTLSEGNLHDTWHVFAVEWEADQIRWYLDEHLFQTIDRPAADGPDNWPFDDGHPFYIIVNLAVGGLFDDFRDPPPDMAPQRLYVDYVRVYQAD